MPKKTSSKIFKGFRIDQSLVKAIEYEAVAQSKTQAQIITQALEEWLQEHGIVQEVKTNEK